MGLSFNEGCVIDDLWRLDKLRDLVRAEGEGPEQQDLFMFLDTLR